MPNYRRWRREGGSYFFTVTLADRRTTLLVDQIDALRDAVARVQSRYPFEIDGAVVLPEHLHMIWTLPAGDADFAKRWRLIKSGFSRRLTASPDRTASQVEKREKGIWQRRFYEHLIRDENDFNQHLDYIHFNPVKHGHVKRPADWPHSSIHRYIREGVFDAEWGTNGIRKDLNLG